MDNDALKNELVNVSPMFVLLLRCAIAFRRWKDENYIFSVIPVLTIMSRLWKSDLVISDPVSSSSHIWCVQFSLDSGVSGLKTCMTSIMISVLRSVPISLVSRSRLRFFRMWIIQFSVIPVLTIMSRPWKSDISFASHSLFSYFWPCCLEIESRVWMTDPLPVLTWLQLRSSSTEYSPSALSWPGVYNSGLITAFRTYTSIVVDIMVRLSSAGL